MDISDADLKEIQEGYKAAYKVIMHPSTRITEKNFVKVDIGLYKLNNWLKMRSKDND